MKTFRNSTPLFLGSVLILTVALLVAGCGPGEEMDTEQELTEITVGSFPFPAMNSTFYAIMTDQGFGEEHGLDVTVSQFSEISSYYASVATGEVDTLIGGPPVLQRMVNEGAPLQGIATFAGLGPVVVISRTEDVQSIEDLEGHSIAASTGSAEFQILSIYANSVGMNLLEDAEVVEASPPQARSQLEAGRVDTALMFEPTTSLTLYDNPDFSIVFQASEVWEDMTGVPGWELMQFMRRDFIEENPDAVNQWIEAKQATQAFIEENPEEAASIVQEQLDLPEDVFMLAHEEGRLDYDVRPAWDQEVHDALWVMFRLANTHGYAESLPPDDMLYSPE